MMQYLGSPWFWVSVIVVTVAVHLVMTTLLPNLFGGGGGS